MGDKRNGSGFAPANILVQRSPQQGQQNQQNQQNQLNQPLQLDLFGNDLASGADDSEAPGYEGMEPSRLMTGLSSNGSDGGGSHNQ
jgi:hypothetical protein